jgi:hypothetical protein
MFTIEHESTGFHTITPRYFPAIAILPRLACIRSA